MGIFYHMGFLKRFYIFVRGVHIAGHIVEKITAFSFSYPAYDVEIIKACSTINPVKIKRNFNSCSSKALKWI